MTEAPPSPTKQAVERIDKALADIQPGRNLVTIDEHTDLLLDLRSILTKEG